MKSENIIEAYESIQPNTDVKNHTQEGILRSNLKNDLEKDLFQ